MKIFNVKFVIDDGQVRLEHVSYFDDDEIGLDLTAADYEKFITEIKWKYKSLDIPYKETYQFNKRESRDFPNCTIQYDWSPNMNNEDISVSCIDFDLGAIQILPEDEVGNGDEHSWVLLVLDENGKIKNDSGLLNNPFSCENLIRKLHVYDKPAQYGYIDGERVDP